MVAEESNLLKWAGQFQTATTRDRRLERIQPALLDMPNAPLETKRTNVGNFRGIEQPLFPCTGVRNLRIFTGVEEDLLESLIQERPRTQADGAQVPTSRFGTTTARPSASDHECQPQR